MTLESSRRGPAAKKSILLLLALVSLLGCSFVGSVNALQLDANLEGFGVRVGKNFRSAGLDFDPTEDFEQADIFALIKLPWWHRDFESGWQMRTRMHVSAGIMEGAGDRGYIATISPGVVFHKPAWRLTVDFGLGGALIDDYHFGEQPLGGPFQFVGHLGVAVNVTPHLSVGWRFHHISDADMYGENEGVDLHMLEFTYLY